MATLSFSDDAEGGAASISRALFAEPSPTKYNTAALNTITNEVRPDINAKRTISNFPKSWQNQENHRPNLPARNHVKEMKRQVKEKISTPSKAPRSAGTINIPMNKVNELKKKLLESKMQEEEKLKSALMNAKKRAEIKERVNTVQGLLKGLNVDRSTSTTVSRNMDLNLPRDRVSAMKTWLKDWEERNKAHADMWNRTPTQYMRASTGGRSEGSKVGELTEWLVDFGEGNKAHYEKGIKAPPFPLNSTSQNFQEHPQDRQPSFEDKNEQSSGFYDDDDAVENMSILDEQEDIVKDANISMKPSAGIKSEGDWEEDYQDLMMTVDTEQIDCKESWDQESIISPRENWDEESTDSPQDLLEESKGIQENDNNCTLFNDGCLEDELDEGNTSSHTKVEKQDVEVSYSSQDENFIHGNSPIQEEINELTFHCDDSISKVSFDGPTLDIITADEFAAPANQNRSSIDVEDDTTSLQSSLFGERILRNVNPSDHMISNSFCGNRITDASFAVPTKTATKNEKKKSGIRKIFSSLNCMKNSKTSKAAEIYANNFEETVKPDYDRKKSTKSLFLSPDSEPDRRQDANAYLPNSYKVNNNGPNDFPRHMLLHGKVNPKVSGQVPESPISLASAFRRQLSPDSSCVSGFTDVEACVLKKNYDIGQHVKHLQGIYSSPVQKRESDQHNAAKRLHMF